MDFFDNVVNKSNAIIKERLNNPFGGGGGGGGKSRLEQEADGNQEADQTQTDNVLDSTPCLESTARQQMRSSQDSSNGSGNDPNGVDRSSQFAAMAADAEAVAQKAAKGAKNIGTFLFSMANKAGQTVSQTAKQVKQAVESTNIMTALSREQLEFIKEHGGALQAGELPWNGSGDCQEQADYMREQVLTLSQDKRNFVRSPPADSEFKFEPQLYYPQALSLLKEDPNLNRLRQELVPKLVKEETFWCNYFYRVSMLRQMSERGEQARRGWASSRSSSGEGPDEVGEGATPQGTIDEPASPGYATGSRTIATTATAGRGQQPSRGGDFNLDKVADRPRPGQAGGAAVASTVQQQAAQFEQQELESSESRKLFAEADDLKSKLRELNIGSLDDGNDC